MFKTQTATTIAIKNSMTPPNKIEAGRLRQGTELMPAPSAPAKEANLENQNPQSDNSLWVVIPLNIKFYAPTRGSVDTCFPISRDMPEVAVGSSARCGLHWANRAFVAAACAAFSSTLRTTGARYLRRLAASASKAVLRREPPRTSSRDTWPESLPSCGPRASPPLEYRAARNTVTALPSVAPMPRRAKSEFARRRMRWNRGLQAIWCHPAGVRCGL